MEVLNKFNPSNELAQWREFSLEDEDEKYEKEQARKYK